MPYTLTLTHICKERKTAKKAFERVGFNSDVLVTSEDDEAAFRSCAFGPTDLLPFCRMPLVLVVDSDNAHAFASLRDLAASYAKPLLCLLSPSPATPPSRTARASRSSRFSYLRIIITRTRFNN